MSEADQIPLVVLDNENIQDHHICCALGKDKANRARAEQKKQWLSIHFHSGHRFIKADLQGKAFIEYSPVENSLFPVDAPGYHMIQCFWVAGKYKGQGLGRRLFEACQEDCQRQGSSGLIAISSQKKRPFMTDRKVLQHFGFKLCDQADPYFQLWKKPLRNETVEPSFWESARREVWDGKESVTIFYSKGCPFFPEYGEIMKESALALGLSTAFIEIDSREDLKHLPIPWGMFSSFYQGKLVSHEPMTGDKFTEKLKGLMNP